jgi:decaprenylphospho-beta-D-erythro-pentofuranosid-2-ulose 2-reductase
VKRILIIGATSAIARACAQEWAKQGAAFFLVGRDAKKLGAIVADLCVSGSIVLDTLVMDSNHFTAHQAMIELSLKVLGGIDIALIAHGTLSEQGACEADANLTIREFETNGSSFIALLTILANHFERQRYGSIAVITSVAGDRGRQSNYVYGSAKAAVSSFCEGLRARLFKSGVSLTDIRPGFVATPMTENLRLPLFLVTMPEVVAKKIVKGINNKSDILYVPFFWYGIMLIIRLLPTFIMKRMNL